MGLFSLDELVIVLLYPCFFFFTFLFSPLLSEKYGLDLGCAIPN